MSEKQITVQNRCAFANWRRLKWPFSCQTSKCVVVECWNAERNTAKKGYSPSDGAAFHSLFPEEYWNADEEARAAAPYIWVRSGYCCVKHCIDYIPADAAPEITFGGAEVGPVIDKGIEFIEKARRRENGPNENENNEKR